MADGDEPNYLEELTKHQYASVAANLWQQGNKALAGSALEQLALDLGYSEDEGFVVGTMASERGVQAATGIYNKKYQEAKGNLAVNDLAPYYDDILRGYLSEEKYDKVMRVLGQNGEETYGDIQKKLAKASYILKGEGMYDFSDEEKESAKGTVKKYNPTNEIFSALDAIKTQKLIPVVQDRFNRKAINGMVDELEDVPAAA